MKKEYQSIIAMAVFGLATGVWAAEPPHGAPARPSAPAAPPRVAPAAAPVERASPPAPVEHPQSAAPARENVAPARQNVARPEAEHADHQGDRRSDRRRPEVLFVNPWYEFPYYFGDGFPNYTTDNYSGVQSNQPAAAVPDNTSPGNEIPNNQPQNQAQLPSSPYGPDTPDAVIKALNASPEFHAAAEQVHVAQVAYDAAKTKVLDQLHQTPEYQQAVQRSDHATAQVNAQQQASQGTATPGQLTPAANAHLQANDQVSKMEGMALENDPAASQAKAALDKAIIHRNEIRDTISTSVRGKPPQ